MSWDFETDPEFQAKLDWAAEFVRTEIEPLDYVFGTELLYDRTHPMFEEIIRPLQQHTRAQNLWACHLGPELGGQGYGQVKLGLLNEILGRTSWAPIVFGCQAPDSGNAEIIAHYGTPEQKAKYLQPLLEGRIASCYSMTEPQGGADPSLFTTRAVRDGDSWVINGEKWFSSNLTKSAFTIVMAITDPDVAVHRGASMFLVEKGTPGLEVIRDVGMYGDDESKGTHCYARYNDVRVPLENLLGGEGEAFKIAQTRLSGGRLHHAMRSIGICQRAFDMMCERALSRTTQGEVLARKQMVQDQIADAWITLHQFRLQVLHAAWVMERKGGHGARREIAGVKVTTPSTLLDVTYKAMHLHGSLGVSNEMPFARMWMSAPALATADGPTEVHKVTLAREILKDYKPVSGMWPTEHIPPRRAEALQKYAHVLEMEVGNV